MSQQLFYLAASGLNATMDRLSASTSNLANTNTVGFKAQRPVFVALPYYDQGLPDRVQVQASEDTADFKAGPVDQTGRSLDVAVSGQGWIVVQAKDGTPALTRNGSLSVTAAGVLQTSDGNPVLGEGLTPITLPPLQSVTIGEDGTISGALAGSTPDQVAAVNRILLANPPPTSLQRGTDGLFHDAAGPPTADASVKLQVGALEASNADTVSMMMNMLETTRMFQMQSQLIHTVANQGQGQSSPLTLS